MIPPKKYRISLDVGYTLGIGGGLSGVLQYLDDAGIWQICHNPGAVDMIECDDRFYEIDEAIDFSEWEGEQFIYYAWEKIFDHYNGYEVEDGVYIDEDNTIIIDERGREYSFEEMNRLVKGAGDRYEALYEEVIEEKEE